MVHRANDERLKKLTTDLEEGDASAAWELGWLRDGRALPALVDALAGKDLTVALAAAQAIDVLDTLVPLGRDERVDALPVGRVSLAVAFPAKTNVDALINSPYPPLRAAALRLLLAQGGKSADDAKARTKDDRSTAVQRVRSQFFAILQVDKSPPSKTTVLLPAPKDPEDLKAACAKISEELPALAKQSEWELMRWRVRSMAAWSRDGHQAATDALFELTTTKIQFSWFPGYAQMHLASTGSKEVLTKLKDLFPKADRATLVRGLEQTLFGNALLSYTQPYLNEQTICYVTARKAGREALDDILARAARGDFAALDALGIIGGIEAVAVLRSQMDKDSPEAGTVSFRSAKALARVGTTDALDALLVASDSKVRCRRHAAALFLGQIGGPKATARLRDLLENESDRFIRAVAADGLEQIGDKESQALVTAFRRADASLPERIHQPRNPRFGKDFPVNEWVNLKIRIQAFAEFGEMGWNYDAANRLFFRYGGCSGYTNELTLFDLGTEQFVQRRPNEEMAGWGDRRSSRGCTGGRTWDPYQKVAWIGPVIGGSEADLAIAEYYNKAGGFRLCSYDLATDRFRAAAYFDKIYGGPSMRYAYDWKNGLLIPVKFSPFPNEKPFWVIDTKSDPYADAAWLDKKTTGDYPRDTSHQTAAVDQGTGLLVLYVAPRNDKPPETWIYDSSANVWKNVSPKVQPHGVAGAGFAYDPFHKVLLLQSGKKATQFGGGEDSITWTYDVRTNIWTDLRVQTGPGNPWVGAMDYDPEHNVFVLFNYRDKQVWAYRLKEVAAGTKVK